MATDNSDTTVRDERKAEMGSDERAQEKRRQIQKIIRAGDEEGITELFSTLNNYLDVPLRSKGAKFLLPAAMAAAEGLGKLCNVGESEAEALLVRALDGSNRLQCAAADALGLIGTSACQDHLENVKNTDKSAAVRARAKIAIRRLQRRELSSKGGSIGKVQTYDELLAIVKQACEQLTAANPNFKQVDRFVPENQRLGKIEKIPNLFEVELEPSEGRKQKVYILIGNMVAGSVGGRGTNISVEDKRAGLFDDRALAMGINVHSNYIVLFTPFCRAEPQKNSKPYSQSLELNALRLEPDSHKTSTNFSFFTKGAIGIYDLQGIAGPQGVKRKEFCMLETVPINDVSLDAIRSSVQVLAFTGDELEKEYRSEGSE
jgi:hypothetical protein